MTEPLVFAGYPVYRKVREDPLDADVAAKEVTDLLDRFGDRVQVRGTYSLTGLRAGADLMFWWVASSLDDLQDLAVEFRRTRLGVAMEQIEMFSGLVRPAEFARDHLPAFVQGKEPKKYLCVYPFVRTPEWYLLPAEERGRYLRDHGEAGREYPEVLANTTSAFGLGDHEWILAFEADGPERIVELIHRLRATEARLFTKLETPFYTGIRKPVEAVVSDLV